MPSHSNYSILIGLFFLAFVQEDSAVVSSALLGYNGIFPYWLTFAACFLGMWVSDIGIYLLMKLGGRRVLESRWAQRLLPRDWMVAFGFFAVRVSWPIHDGRIRRSMDRCTDCAGKRERRNLGRAISLQPQIQSNRTRRERFINRESTRIDTKK